MLKWLTNSPPPPSDPAVLLSIPNHVAFIMDGNRRWARLNNLSNNDGYRKGLDRMSEIVLKSFELNIKALTFFALSKENWNRSKEDVNAVLFALEEALTARSGKAEIKKWIEKGAKITFPGDLTKFPSRIEKKLLKIEEESSSNTAITIQIALNYSGRDDIAKAAEKLVNKFLRDDNNGLDGRAVKIDEDQLASFLMTKGVADPDLLIRTGNEIRISNFMIWQISYCELFFSKKMWPDFTASDFQNALEDYQLRNRRYGAK